MKQIIVKLTLSVALYIMTIAAASAQEPSEVEAKVNELAKKYENVKGVDCVSVTKGSGLGLVKAMLNKEFGKDFMKGVTSINFINYSDASQETCQSLRKELDGFLSLLEEFKDEDKESTDYEFVRSFALPIDKNTISDFVIAMEDKESKMIIYMAGKIKID
jgi:hypothetical protein